MLKAIRVILAIFSILAVTLLFVDFTGTGQQLWPWIDEIQFIPALISLNVVALIIILGATLLLGRIYCSVICPLGIFQDVVNWLRSHIGPKRKRINRFRFTQAQTRWRLSILTAFVVLFILGLTQLLAASIAGLIEPYSAYGRIASQIFAPAYAGINNLLASWSESQVDNYMFYRVVCAISVPVLVVAIITLVVVVLFAWMGGRDYCNTICPVGTILGYLSKCSLFKIVIDTDKCINCGKCGRNCKAKCIDTKQHAVDYTRCVVCMDCINVCSEGAVRYTWRRSEAKASDKKKNAAPDASRRAFVSGVGFVAGALAMEAVAKTTDGGLTALKSKKAPKRAVRLVPAGAVSLANVSKSCTACQQCISQCPSKILKPSVSLDNFMQPEIDYTNGYCDVECTRCSEVCPVGVFEKIDKADKSAIKIGTAVVNINSCISAADGVKCGKCSRVCPTGAITMVSTDPDDSGSNRMPVVNDAACIGCGKCEFYCPVGTVEDMSADGSAIHVEGIEVHRNI